MEDALHLEEKEQPMIPPVEPQPAKETTISKSNSSDRRTRRVNAQPAWASLIPGTNKKSTAVNKRVNENTTIMPKEAQIAAPALAPQNELDDDKLNKVYQ